MSHSGKLQCCAPEPSSAHARVLSVLQVGTGSPKAVCVRSLYVQGVFVLHVAGVCKMAQREFSLLRIEAFGRARASLSAL